MQVDNGNNGDVEYAGNISGVSPDFKKMMDQYETFFDKYIEFMQEYNSSDNAMTMYQDYISLLKEYMETMEAMTSIEESSLSEADELYYVEVTSRITQKLLEAAY